MKNVLKKLSVCKQQIKETKLKKLGYNDYSKYHYFLPEQVEQLVFDTCQKNGLFSKFDLKRNEFGEYGVLSIYCIESGECVTFEMASAIPEIKATNIAQQLGGAMTYTERYLKQTAFGISDNTLDFDTPTNQPQKAKSEQSKANNQQPITWLTEAQYKAALASDAKGISATLKKYSTDTYKMKSEYARNLNIQLKKLQDENN